MVKPAQIISYLGKIGWGEMSLLALYISVLSGLLVALQYNHITPYYSVSSMDLLVPFGDFFRSLHFYSSQLFFLFCVCHFIAIFNVSGDIPTGQWLKLTLSLPVALLVLFTGYVLRGDSTGFSAGIIAESILLTIPVIGKNLNDLLFSISDNGMQRVYVNHIIGLGLLWGWMVWRHVKKYKAPLYRNIFTACAILLFSVFVCAPLEPEHLGVIHIAGPWFFLGLQELLRYLDPLTAGVLFPASMIIALCLYRTNGKNNRVFCYFIIAWLIIYLGLSLISFGR